MGNLVMSVTTNQILKIQKRAKMNLIMSVTTNQILKIQKREKKNLMIIVTTNQNLIMNYLNMKCEKQLQILEKGFLKTLTIKTHTSRMPYLNPNFRHIQNFHVLLCVHLQTEEEGICLR